VLGGVPTAFRPLRHRDFRLLWTGLAISLVGSGLWLVALAWQAIELGGGPTELSLVTALFSVGLLAFVLIGGVAADRLPQRLVMLAADLIRAAVLVILGLPVFLFGMYELYHWTHAELYDPRLGYYDPIVAGKAAYFFWPAEAGTFP
jgi:MFS family permease